ncbi:MAG: hypothetical protein GY938_30950, partial [Ketobacter sp.]|nr:hypothetical protein [Ketobacter sp.]
MIEGRDPIYIETDNVTVDNTQFIELYGSRDANILSQILVQSSVFKMDSGSSDSWLVYLSANDDIQIMDSRFVNASVMVYCNNNGNEPSPTNLNIVSTEFEQFTHGKTALFIDTNDTDWSPNVTVSQSSVVNNRNSDKENGL